MVGHATQQEATRGPGDRFGDWDPDDSLDTEPADPEQVAIKLHGYRRETETLPHWNQLTQDERQRAIGIIVRLFAWLRRQGATLMGIYLT